MYHAIFHEDCQTIETCIKEQLKRTISYYDAVESFYHGFLVGLLSGLHDCWMKSNRESGNGRTDITIAPLDNTLPAIIIELKRVTKMTEMSDGCDQALAQIDEKHYIDELVEDGYENFIKYGICFCRKDCRVKCRTQHVELGY
jgi:hypothetical protein